VAPGGTRISSAIDLKVGMWIGLGERTAGIENGHQVEPT